MERKYNAATVNDGAKEENNNSRDGAGIEPEELRIHRRVIS